MLILSDCEAGSQTAPFDAQLLILSEVLSDRELAMRMRFVWSALGSASHVGRIARARNLYDLTCQAIALAWSNPGLAVPITTARRLPSRSPHCHPL